MAFEKKKGCWNQASVYQKEHLNRRGSKKREFFKSHCTEIEGKPENVWNHENQKGLKQLDGWMAGFKCYLGNKINEAY